MRRAVLLLLLLSLTVPARAAAPARSRRPPAEDADDASDAADSKAAGAKGSVDAKDSDDSDDSDDADDADSSEAAAARPAPASARGTGKVAKAARRPAADDDSEDEEDEPAPPKKARPAPRKPAAKEQRSPAVTFTAPVGPFWVSLSNPRPAQGSVMLVRCKVPGTPPAAALGVTPGVAPAGAGGGAPGGAIALVPVTITATFTGRTFVFYPTDAPGAQIGLIGVDLELAPGPQELVLTAATTPPTTQRVPITVVAGDFSVQRLKVPPKMVNPDPEAEKRIAREQAVLDHIFKQVTPQVFHAPFIKPVPGAATASFGGRRIFNGVPKSPHSGVDLRGATGTPIKAPAPGRVMLVADHYFTGNTVILDHGLGIFTQYAHMSAFSVKEGQIVKPGDLLGKVGETGRVTGPHLHWGAKLSGARVNPMDLTKLPL